MTPRERHRRHVLQLDRHLEAMGHATRAACSGEQDADLWADSALDMQQRQDIAENGPRADE